MKLKKLMALILALSLSLVLPLTVFAVPDATVNVNSAEGTFGGEVTFTATLAGAVSVRGGSVELSYDEEVLELVSGSWNLDTIPAPSLVTFDATKDKGAFAYTSATEISGVVFTAVFNILEDADPGKSDVSIVLVLKDADLADMDVENNAGVLTVNCSHPEADKNTTEAVAPTCQAVGYTAGVFCNRCNSYISGHEEVPKTDTHSYGDSVKVDETSHKHICSVCGKEETLPHTWDDGQVTVQPTHTAKGEKKFTCTACGAVSNVELDPLTDHAYGDWTVLDEEQHQKSCICGDFINEDHTWNNGEITTAPTCKDTGIKTYTCTANCGATKTEVLPKTDTHSYGDFVRVDETSHKHTCSVCEKEETLAHTWDKGVPTTPPTCKDTGIKTFTCTACDETKTEVMEKTEDHTYGDWTKVDDKNHKRVCSVCEKEDKTAHAWGNGKVTTPATHLTEGEKLFTCVCGATKTDAVEKTKTHTFGDWETLNSAQHKRTCECGEEEIKGHTWDTGVVTKRPTEKSSGERVFTCTACGEQEYERIQKLDHVHVYGAVWQKDGSNHWKVCACGDKAEITAHSWDEGTVTTPATCEATGKKTVTCTVCGETSEDTVALTGHTGGVFETVTEPTCTEAGKQVQKCTVCGETLKEEEIPADGHRFGEWDYADGKLTRACTACGETESKEATPVTEIKNDDSDIVLRPTENVTLPAGTKLEADEVALSGAERTSLEASVKVLNENNEVLAVYDITLDYEGAKIQPDGKVKVTLPLPNTGDGSEYAGYKIVYISEGKAPEVMPSEVEGNTITFTTDHFSRYAVIGETAPATAPAGTTSVWLIVLIALVVLGAVAAVVVIVVRKKKANA